MAPPTRSAVRDGPGGVRPAGDGAAFSGARLVRGVILSGLALGLPLFAGLWLIPILLDALGQVRFGLLTLCWGLLGYLAVLDLGVGRAATKLIAEARGAGARAPASPLHASALLVAFCLGCVGAAATAAAAWLLPAPILGLAPELDAELRRALLWLAPTVPVILLSEAAKGVIEGHGRFDVTALIRLPLGVLNYAAPVVACAFGADLAGAVAAILLVRIGALGAYLGVLAAVVGTLRVRAGTAVRDARRLLALGGWMTVSSVLAPVFAYLDRFVIAVLASVEAVAFYTTPFEVVTKLAVIADALMVVAFPTLAWWAAKDAARVPALYARFVKAAVVLVFPAALAAIAFAPEFLRVWLGAEYEMQSGSVLRLLALGTLLNSIARVPFGLLQSLGRADLTAKIHLAEALPYALVLVWLVDHAGIAGAALAWTLRAGVDLAALAVAAGRVAPRGAGPAVHWWLAPALALGLAASAAPIGIGARAWIVAVVAALFAALAWRCLLDAGERAAVRDAGARVARGALRWG